MNRKASKSAFLLTFEFFCDFFPYGRETNAISAPMCVKLYHPHFVRVGNCCDVLIDKFNDMVVGAIERCYR